MNGATADTFCRSRQALFQRLSFDFAENQRRYSREQASQRLEVINSIPAFAALGAPAGGIRAGRPCRAGVAVRGRCRRDEPRCRRDEPYLSALTEPYRFTNYADPSGSTTSRRTSFRATLGRTKFVMLQASCSKQSMNSLVNKCKFALISISV